MECVWGHEPIGSIIGEDLMKNIQFGGEDWRTLYTIFVPQFTPWRSRLETLCTIFNKTTNYIHSIRIKNNKNTSI